MDPQASEAEVRTQGREEPSTRRVGKEAAGSRLVGLREASGKLSGNESAVHKLAARQLAGRSSGLWLLHALALLPLVLLLADAQLGRLSFNPIQDITQRTGKPALWLLLATLSVTPAGTLLGWRKLAPHRRTLGLYTFLYACLHSLTFVWLDYGLDPALLREAIFEKPYALVGFSAFVLLLALALTSTRAWMRRLGKRWKRLHQLVYPASLLVILHYAWSQKADWDPRPLAYGGVLILLLGLRLPALRKRVARWRARSRKQSGEATP